MSSTRRALSRNTSFLDVVLLLFLGMLAAAFLLALSVREDQQAATRGEQVNQSGKDKDTSDLQATLLLQGTRLRMGVAGQQLDPGSARLRQLLQGKKVTLLVPRELQAQAGNQLGDYIALALRTCDEAKVKSRTLHHQTTEEGQ